MSIDIMRACWPLQISPTAKYVLIALADHADDSGRCWPSLSKLCERTGLGRTAVIESIKVLEKCSAICADRTDRYRTTYAVTPDKFAPELVRVANQSVRRTSTHGGALVREADNEVRQTDNEVREADTNHQEPSITINKATTNVSPEGDKPKRSKAMQTPPMPDGVAPQVWADWLTLRKSKKAPVTETVIASAVTEAGKAGMPLNDFLSAWCASGYQGFKADWIKPRANGPPPGRVPVNANFNGKNYQGDSDDELPDFLRAQRAVG